MNRYVVKQVIGEGAYGVVLKCKHKVTKELVAIKKFKDSEDDSEARRSIMRELSVLQKLKQENIIGLREAFRRKGKLYMVFEYVEKTLLQILEENPGGLGLRAVRSYTFQLIKAVNCCHKNDVIHRDIKPENLLISQRGVLKLCDFGFARTMSTHGSVPFTDYVATRWYRAPELLLGAFYGAPVDIWSIGCIVGEMADGRPVFPGESEIDQLFVIQKIMGSLPPDQMELFVNSPRFVGLKFPETGLSSQGFDERFESRMDAPLMALMKVNLMYSCGNCACLFSVQSLLQLRPQDRLTAMQCLDYAAFGIERELLGDKPLDGALKENRQKAVAERFVNKEADESRQDSGVIEGETDGDSAKQRTVKGAREKLVIPFPNKLSSISTPLNSLYSVDGEGQQQQLVYPSFSSDGLERLSIGQKTNSKTSIPAKGSRKAGDLSSTAYTNLGTLFPDARSKTPSALSLGHSLNSGVASSPGLSLLPSTSRTNHTLIPKSTLEESIRTNLPPPGFLQPQTRQKGDAIEGNDSPQLRKLSNMCLPRRTLGGLSRVSTSGGDLNLNHSYPPPKLTTDRKKSQVNRSTTTPLSDVSLSAFLPSRKHDSKSAFSPTLSDAIPPILKSPIRPLPMPTFVSPRRFDQLSALTAECEGLAGRNGGEKTTLKPLSTGWGRPAIRQLGQELQKSKSSEQEDLNTGVSDQRFKDGAVS
eukprot:m.133027 g.133027  ORF g.133027 m.133027 type:complete len:701 (+) comp38097_c0_seq5:59-2161(+)